MTRRFDHVQLLTRKEIVHAPTLPSCTGCGDHSFELPTGLYIATAGLFFAFVAILALTFNGHMAVSYGIIVAFIVAFFAVPTIFTHVGRDEAQTVSRSWQQFLNEGVDTASGHCSGKDATVLVLLLPSLIFCFGAAVVFIRALVN